MQPGSASSAAKVGLFVLAFVALLAIGWQFFGGRIFDHGPQYVFSTNDAGGITPGAKVEMAGVAIGRVTKVWLAGPNDARMVLSLDPGRSIQQGSSGLIPSSLISLATDVVDVVPPATVQPELPPGSVIYGTKQNMVEEFLPDARKTLNELNKTLVAAQGILNDQKMRGSLEAVLQSSQKTLEKFGALADSTQSLIATNRAGLAGALKNAQDAMASVNKGVTLAYSILKSGKYQRQTSELLASLNTTAGRAQKLMTDMDTFIQDPHWRQPFNDLAANAAKMSDQGVQIASSVKVIAQNGEQVSQKAIALTQQATEVATEAKTLVKKLEGLTDKVSAKVDSFGGGGKSLIGTVHAEADLFHEGSPNRWRTDFNITAPIGKETIYAGVYDAFEANRLNLQLGYPVSKDLLIRYGAYAGKAGLGVDYQIAPRLGFRSNLFDLNNPEFDLGMHYDLGGGLIGWIGYDRLFERNRFLLGIGFQK